MSKVDVVKNLLSAVEKCKFDVATELLTSDFTFSGPSPKPLNAQEWFDFHKKLGTGLPDFKFNVKDLNESGNVVNGTVQLSGTQTKEIPSIFPGIDAISPTNKKIQLGEEDFTVSFKGDKISNLTVEKVENGGIKGILMQLGVSIPAALK